MSSYSYDINNIGWWIVVNVKTIGIPNKIDKSSFYPYFKNEAYDNARMVEIAWTLNYNTSEISKKEFIIKPIDFKIPSNQSHGISQEYANENGKLIDNVLEEFGKDLVYANTIVGHNVVFMISIIANELYRLIQTNKKTIYNETLQKLITTQQRCTLVENISMYKKFIRLSELYEKMFKDDEINYKIYNRSIYCIKLVKQCFIKMCNDVMEKLKKRKNRKHKNHHTRKSCIYNRRN